MYALIVRTPLVAALMSSAAFAAEPAPKIAAAPDWVTAVTVPDPDPKLGDQPLQMLSTSLQYRVYPDGLHNYIEYVALPQNIAGLQGLGTITVPWNSERTEMYLHRFAIRREGREIDLLKAGEITVLRRENNLEKAMLDGIRTVVIPAQGLQVGDRLVVAVSYRTKPSSVQPVPEEVIPINAPIPIQRVERRILIPDSVKASWKISDPALVAKVSRNGAMVEHLFVQTNVKPVEIPADAPDRLKLPVLQFSSYPSWAAVAQPLVPHFAAARKVADGSPVALEADRIKASTADPELRMLAALRLVQDKVRYVALLLGEGAYVPSSAEESWSRKFGDCKGKTALLLALLDRLGIAAEPLLVSNQFYDRLHSQLPSLALFDHVIVRARINGKTYYLDGTDYGQRTLEEVAGSVFRFGLPLVADAALEPLRDVIAARPLREATIRWDASGGIDEEVPYEATLTLRGHVASAFRAKLAAATDAKEFDTGLKDLVPAIDNDDLVIAEKQPDSAGGEFIVRFKGRAEMDWSPLEGERNARYAFAHRTIRWRPDFKRDEEKKASFPVLLTLLPYWERTTETIVLPADAKAYKLDGESLNRKIAGSSLSRTLSREANLVSMISEFRHDQREISAEEARIGEAQLKDFNKISAYVVGPKLPRRKAEK